MSQPGCVLFKLIKLRPPLQSPLQYMFLLLCVCSFIYGTIMCKYAHQVINIHKNMVLIYKLIKYFVNT